jgi:hypothetical protein
MGITRKKVSAVLEDNRFIDEESFVSCGGVDVPSNEKLGPERAAKPPLAAIPP